MEAAIIFHVGDDEGLDDGHVIGDDMNFKNIFMRWSCRILSFISQLLVTVVGIRKREDSGSPGSLVTGGPVK